MLMIVTRNEIRGCIAGTVGLLLLLGSVGCQSTSPGVTATTQATSPAGLARFWPRKAQPTAEQQIPSPQALAARGQIESVQPAGWPGTANTSATDPAAWHSPTDSSSRTAVRHQRPSSNSLPGTSIRNMPVQTTLPLVGGSGSC
jgi:hypothetical protein